MARYFTKRELHAQIWAHTRKFNKNHIRYHKIDVSTYLPYPLEDTLFDSVQQGLISIDDYIIGPLYEEKWRRGRRGSLEIQIGVTGGMKYNETSEQAIKREMGEETGLIPKRPVQVYKEEYGERGNIMTTYLVNVDDSVLLPYNKNNVTVNRHKDMRGHKVGSIIYGDLDTIREILDKDNIYLYKSEDNIVGIGAMRVSDVMNFIYDARDYFMD